MRGKRNGMRLNVVIVDDHVIFTEGLAALLGEVPGMDIKVVLISHDGKDVDRIVEKRRIHLVFLDLNLGEINGLDLIAPLKDASPDTRIMVVSGYDDQKFVKQAFINGTDGYMLKGSPLSELIEGIETVMEDNTFMGRGVQVTARSYDRKRRDRKKGQRYMDSFALKNHLTKREHEILHLITEAFSNKEIAEKLFISDQTVSVHRKNIMRKLGVSNTVSLVKAANDLKYQLDN